MDGKGWDGLVFNNRQGQEPVSVEMKILPIFDGEMSRYTPSLGTASLYIEVTSLQCRHLIKLIKVGFFEVVTPLGDARCFICASETFLLVFWLSRLCFLTDFVDQKFYGLTKLCSSR